MAKAPGAPAEKKEEHAKPAAHADHGAKEGGGSKKVSSAKGHNPAPGGCHAWGCKGSEKRFTFCEEHYEQFKFGLIRKTGDPVPDYEKKFEHYEAYKARSKSHKVA